MKKILLSCILASILVGVAACGKEKNTETLSYTSDTPEESTTVATAAPVCIDIFENVEFVDIKEVFDYLNDEGEQEYNLYPGIGCFTTEKNPYWGEYIKTKEDDYIPPAYSVIAQEVGLDGIKVELRFFSISTFDNYLEENNYVISETTKEYFIPNEGFEMSLLSEKYYTPEVSKEVDKFLMDSISEEKQLSDYEVSGRYLVVPTSEAIEKSSASIYYGLEDWTSHVEFQGRALAVRTDYIIDGVYYILKNKNSGEYILRSSHPIIKNNKVIKNEFRVHNPLTTLVEGAPYDSFDAAYGDIQRIEDRLIITLE